MKPYDYQIKMAEDGYNVLRRFMMVYLAAEERVGKTLPAILIAEKCNVNSVLVITKKKALDGWHETLEKYPHKKKYNVTNYHQAHKFGKHDLLILDEAHNYIAGYPKQSGMHKTIQEQIAVQTPIIYISATPHAQGYQMLYHQFALSSWSPWRKYKDFYHWFRTYGIPSTSWFNGRQVPVYTKTKEELIVPEIQHLFITDTRKNLGFEHEPVDKLHYIELSERTRDCYNMLMKDKYFDFGTHELICDTPMKLRTSLHMLEGGAAKIEGEYLVLPNTEKIEYIKKHWIDTKDLVIFYHYIAEGQKLREHFKHAQILQGTSNAEGIDLAHVDEIVVYSQDFSTAKHTQRRARQAAKHRDKPITVHFLLVKKAVSEQVYTTVSVNKQNFVDSVFERNYI